MSEELTGRLANRTASLLRSAVLLAGLAAILFFAYGLVLPLSPGPKAWRIPILIAALGGLALTLAWPARQAAERIRRAYGIALVLGTASLIFGLAAILLAGGFVLRATEQRTSAMAMIYQMTHPRVMAYWLAVAGFVAVPGGLGLWVARRGGRPPRRTSMAGAAYRFSVYGMGLAGLLVAAVTAALGYRWLMWG